jgi:hypothetical protein
MPQRMYRFDNAKMALEDKIKLCKEAYCKRYEINPNRIFVHPSMLSNDVLELLILNTRVIADKYILKNNFLVGVE